MAAETLPWGEILAIASALVFSYAYARRTWWTKEETEYAARWYSDQRGWEVRESDLDATAEFVQEMAKFYGWLALVSWAEVIYFLIGRG